MKIERNFLDSEFHSLLFEITKICIVFAHWEEQDIALGSKYICQALFITPAIASKDNVFFKCTNVSYIYSHLASIIKILRHPVVVILFMDPEVRKMIRPKVR